MPLMEEYLQRFSEHGVQLKLHLARVLVLHQQRPSKAQKLLGELDEQELSAAQDQLRRQLLRRVAVSAAAAGGCSGQLRRAAAAACAAQHTCAAERAACCS